MSQSNIQPFYDFIRNKMGIPADQLIELVKSRTQDGFEDVISI